MKKKKQTNKLDKKLATFSEFALAYSPKRTMLFAVQYYGVTLSRRNIIW